jgi:hypothetical protein
MLARQGLLQFEPLSGSFKIGSCELFARAQIRRITFESNPGQTVQNRAGRVTQVVEHLSSMCEALSSNSSTAKN